MKPCKVSVQKTSRHDEDMMVTGFTSLRPLLILRVCINARIKMIVFVEMCVFHNCYVCYP